MELILPFNPQMRMRRLGQPRPPASSWWVEAGSDRAAFSQLLARELPRLTGQRAAQATSEEEA